MSDPIQDLKEIVAKGHDRVLMIHRNEWPKLWEAIDRIVAGEFSSQALMDSRARTDQFFRDEAQLQDDIKEAMSNMTVREQLGGHVGHVHVTVGKHEEDVVPPGRYELGEDDFPLLPVLELSHFPLEKDEFPIEEVSVVAGDDPVQWAMWFQVWLEENPNPTPEELEPWFSKVLTIGEIAQHPLIEIEVDADGNILSMKSARVERDWEDDYPWEGPDPEDPGF